MSQRSVALLGGLFSVATLIAAQVWLAFDAGGANAAISRLVVLVLSVAGIVVAAWIVQALLIRGYEREARTIRPDGRVLFVGRMFHAEFGSTRVAVLIEAQAVEIVALPDGRWNETLSFSSVEEMAMTDADSALEWATGIAITVADRATWEVQLEGWRILPKFVLRRQAQRALAELDEALR